MGQDSEEAAELLATIRGEHIPMKAWYNDDSSGKDDVRMLLKQQYGSYPEYWNDVIHWKGWKETRRAYLTYTENPSATTTTTTTTKKRRSRWETDNSATTNSKEEEETTTKRKSRWERAPPETTSNNSIDAALAAAMNVVTQKEASKGVFEILPGLPAGLTEEQQRELAQLQQRLRVANDRLTNLDSEAARIDALPRGHPERSPSPPPVYGGDGKRRNTRAVRWRERYTNERLECLEKMADLNPALRPPGFVRRKRTKKIYIPVDDHPTYNFIGLIIGPRGKTQKDMEQQTNCKIAIRGKGSIKEGARGRRDGKILEGDDEPLHVVVTGDEQENVERAAKMIEDMLIVIDDDKNIHKQLQLRELALLNGTLKEDDYCMICAEKGHRQFECPKRFSNVKLVSAQVKCAICGDSSHPTRDCTQQSQQQQPLKDQKQMDSDYASFMAELDGKPNPEETGSVNGVVVENAQPQPQKEEQLTTTAADAQLPTLQPQLASGTIATPDVAPPAPVALPTAFPLPYGFPPSGGLPPPPTGYPPPPPLAGMMMPPPPPPMGTTLPPAFAFQPMMMGGYPGVPPPAMMVPPSYGSQPPTDAGAFGQQQQDVRTSKGKKNKKRGEVDEELAGWDPSSFYAQGGSGAAAGFNWWEQS